jgi:hypothetical protein
MCSHAGEPDPPLEMQSTLRIRITVRWRLSRRLARAFDGLAIRRHGGATELFGEIADQTQLHGVLTRIRDLGLELESVTVYRPDLAKPATEASASVVTRDVSAPKLGCAATDPVGSNKRNKLEGGLR